MSQSVDASPSSAGHLGVPNPPLLVLISPWSHPLLVRVLYQRPMLNARHPVNKLHLFNLHRLITRHHLASRFRLLHPRHPVNKLHLFNLHRLITRHHLASR
ncbi:MAG: hypothetical protein M1826_006388 [Phylliscum demangeonii]|nr:MAG: hypothetical protein M1826_006388 [Phylliscum demangeonii]